jgi:hypothetical protein
MAAWLVSQYNGGTNIMVPTATAQNTAIQDAIWAITDNNSSSAENGGAFYQISATPSVQGDPTTSDLYWVDQALQHYVAVDTSAWAVLSWQVDPNTGQISNSPDYNNGARQTFLVELDGGTVTTQNLAPEPGFYGALALGLSGLALSLNRRKKKS